MKIRIEIEGRGHLIADLDDRNPKTARGIYENLPIDGRALLWQEEVYFETPLVLDYENPSKTAEKGDISYWPPGRAFCIFFGSSQPYSEVNHVGKIIEGIGILREVKEGDRIIIERLGE